MTMTLTKTLVESQEGGSRRRQRRQQRRHHRRSIQSTVSILAVVVTAVASSGAMVAVVSAPTNPAGPSSPPSISIHLPRDNLRSGSKEDNSYFIDWDDMDGQPNDSSSSTVVVGSGREFSIFESRPLSSRVGRGGSEDDIHNSDDDNNDDDDDDDDDFMQRMELYRRKSPSSAPAAKAALSSSSPFYRRQPPSQQSQPQRQQQKSRPAWTTKMVGEDRLLPRIAQGVQEWWTTSILPNIQSMPKFVVRCQPTTTLKVRKTFRPLKTVIRLGADFNTQLGVWQFKSRYVLVVVLVGTLTDPQQLAISDTRSSL